MFQQLRVEARAEALRKTQPAKPSLLRGHSSQLSESTASCACGGGCPTCQHKSLLQGQMLDRINPNPSIFATTPVDHPFVNSQHISSELCVRSTLMRGV
jgi:hypothetical protein